MNALKNKIMNKTRLINFNAFNERSASLFLILLLFGDLVYILLHIINSFIPLFNGNLFDITTDFSYAEWYQYMKFFFITLLVVKVSIGNEPMRYLAWASVFAYMLIDDSMEIHGRLGGYIALHFLQDFKPPLGLRLEDIGSLAASAMAGIILIIFISWAYWRGSKRFKKVSHDFMLLVFIMVFFGVFFDMVHVAISGGIAINLILEIIEDGGEMVAASLILWYTFFILLRKGKDAIFLWDCIQLPFKKSHG